MACDEIGNVVYVLAWDTPDGLHRSVVRDTDGGIMMFHDPYVPNILCAAFNKQGRPCVVLTFDLRYEDPCVI